MSTISESIKQLNQELEQVGNEQHSTYIALQQTLDATKTRLLSIAEL